MARSGWSTSNFLRCSSGLITAMPLTMVAWFNTSITGVSQRLVCLANSASGNTLNSFILGVNAANAISATTGDGASAGAAVSSATITANTWLHAAAVFTSATGRAAYLNGANKGTAATNLVPSGINRTSIGVNDQVSPANPLAPAGTGMIAEVALWSMALSDADVLALSRGLSPLRMHPEALVAYWPLLGRNSPENNFKSNAAAMSVVGSLSQVAHPRIIMPRRRPLLRAA